MSVSVDILARYYGSTISLQEWLPAGLSETVIQQLDSEAFQDLIKHGRVAAATKARLTRDHRLKDTAQVSDVVQEAQDTLFEQGVRTVLTLGYKRVSLQPSLLFIIYGKPTQLTVQDLGRCFSKSRSICKYTS